MNKIFTIASLLLFCMPIKAEKLVAVCKEGRTLKKDKKIVGVRFDAPYDFHNLPSCPPPSDEYYDNSRFPTKYLYISQACSKHNHLPIAEGMKEFVKGGIVEVGLIKRVKNAINKTKETRQHNDHSFQCTNAHMEALPEEVFKKDHPGAEIKD